MFKFLVLLPCLLLAADVSGQCTQLLACENTISEDTFFMEEASMVSYMNEAQALDHVCTELGNLTGCINANLGSCHDNTIKNEVKAVKDIIEYMCSTSGRQVVLGLAQSTCADNPLLELHMETMMQGCLETFQFNLQMEALDAAFSGRELQMHEVCPFVDQLKVCLVNGATGMCGSHMGTFVSNIWDIAARDQFAEFGCTTGLVHKRRYVKRAVPMLLKRSTMVKKLMK